MLMYFYLLYAFNCYAPLILSLQVINAHTYINVVATFLEVVLPSSFNVLSVDYIGNILIVTL